MNTPTPPPRLVPDRPSAERLAQRLEYQAKVIENGGFPDTGKLREIAAKLRAIAESGEIARVVGCTPGLSRVELSIDGVLPDWLEIGSTVYVGTAPRVTGGREALLADDLEAVAGTLGDGSVNSAWLFQAVYILRERAALQAATGGEG